MYPVGEFRDALAAALRDGVDVPANDHTHDVVRVLERRGYLPRDRARVWALTERATAAARARVREQAATVEQLSMPWDGRWMPDEPEQLRLIV